MDIVTHGLASLAVARAFFPRARKRAAVTAVVAGILPDVDWLSSLFGPAAYFSWHGTYTHSILAALLVVSIIPAILLGIYLVQRNIAIAIIPQNGEELPTDPQAITKYVSRTAGAVFLAAPLSAALLHLAMDACQSDGVALLWPFTNKRFAADCLPSLDPWILTILIAAIALPELLHLVSSEIGAKAKKPRGQTGAIVGLVLVLAYVGVRATLHTNAMAMLQARTYRGETPRRTSAFPESASLLTWRGIVETEGALHEIAVDVTAGSSFDAESGLNIFKPEPSAVLDSARNTDAARKFLGVARFPKANVEKTDTGYVVELRDLRYSVADEKKHEVTVVIELDPAGKVKNQEFTWARDLHH